MLNEQKLKQIQGLVKNATVLSEQEKNEWMALIELMNDKQIAELEEILQKPKPEPVAPAQPQPQPQPKPQPVPQQQPRVQATSPTLSHISNLPNQLSDQKQDPLVFQSAAPSVPSATRTAPAAPIVTPQTASRPAPTPMPPHSQVDPLRPRSVPEPVSMPAPTPKPIEAVPMPPVTPLSIPKSTYRNDSASLNTMVLTKFEDISKLTSSALHQQNRELFHKTINELAAQYGYFQVVTNLEQSPLYQDYLDYGKNMLMGKKDNLALSQEEFEFIADILLSLKVNRF